MLLGRKTTNKQKQTNLTKESRRVFLKKISRIRPNLTVDYNSAAQVKGHLQLSTNLSFVDFV